MLSIDSWNRRLSFVDEVLRTHTNSQSRPPLSIPVIVASVVIFGLLYGGAMGSYAWVVGKRSLLEQFPQMVFSAIKVPLLLGVTTLIALPSFFVFNTLLGLRDDFRVVLRSIISIQAGLTIILASLAPFTLLFYFSATGDAAYSSSILFNSLMFGTASVSAQVLLRVYYRPLISRNNLHSRMLMVWIAIYAFVGIQCAWILRPFIGDPELSIAFFRNEKFGNAYVKVWELICNVVQGG